MFCTQEQGTSIFFNLLWPNDAIRRHNYLSLLVQVVDCCLTAPSHYLCQCWFNTAGVLWYSPESNFTFHELHPKDVFGDNTFKIIAPSPRAKWVYMIPKDNRCCVCHVELSDQMVTFLELHIIFAQLVHVLSHFVWQDTSSFAVSSFNPLQTYNCAVAYMSHAMFNFRMIHRLFSYDWF